MVDLGARPGATMPRPSRVGIDVWVLKRPFVAVAADEDVIRRLNIYRAPPPQQGRSDFKN